MRILSIAVLACFLTAGCSISTRQQEKQETPCLARQANQDEALDLLEKLGEIYGNNPPGSVGFTVQDNDRCPDFISGTYLNKEGRLVVQIVGDSLTYRRKLEEALQSQDFVVETIDTSRFYTEKQLHEIMGQLNRRLEKLQGSPVIKNFSSAGVLTSERCIDVTLISNTAEKRKEFREKVMDSPAFRFNGPELPEKDETVGVSDTLGIHFQPEKPSFPTTSEHIVCLLSNHGKLSASFGAHYFVTYEDEQGIWRKLPTDAAAIDIAYGLSPDETFRYHAHIYPTVNHNRPGRYRLFTRVDIGKHKGILMMAEFRLADEKK